MKVDEVNNEASYDRAAADEKAMALSAGAWFKKCYPDAVEVPAARKVFRFQDEASKRSYQDCIVRQFKANLDDNTADLTQIDSEIAELLNKNGLNDTKHHWELEFDGAYFSRDGEVIGLVEAKSRLTPSKVLRFQRNIYEAVSKAGKGDANYAFLKNKKVVPAAFGNRVDTREVMEAAEEFQPHILVGGYGRVLNPRFPQMDDENFCASLANFMYSAS